MPRGKTRAEERELMLQTAKQMAEGNIKEMGTCPPMCGASIDGTWVLGFVEPEEGDEEIFDAGDALCCMLHQFRDQGAYLANVLMEVWYVDIEHAVEGVRNEDNPHRKEAVTLLLADEDSDEMWHADIHRFGGVASLGEWELHPVDQVLGKLAGILNGTATYEPIGKTYSKGCSIRPGHDNPETKELMKELMDGELPEDRVDWSPPSSN